MKQELGNLMAEDPQQETINLLTYRLNAVSTELAAVTEQRDAVTLRLGDTQVRMFDAERQRDRLAAAIRKHKKEFPFAPDFCDVELYEALQSLNPDHTVKANDMTAAVKGGSHES